MCYTKNASVGGLITGLASSIALITLGDEKYKSQNLAIGLFFILVSFVQLVDYMIYIDPNCKTGSNQLASYIGPLLTAFQPTILFFLYLLLLNKSKIYNQHTNFFIAINVLYTLALYVMYSQFVLNEDLCSHMVKGRPKWAWSKGPFYNFTFFAYPLMLIINIIAVWNISNFYVNLAIVIVLILYLMTKINYPFHVPEFWCYFSNSVPLLILVIQKILG